MPLMPADVANKQFRNAFRGYNEEEVDAFLDEVETELARLYRENDQLRIRGGRPVEQPAPAPVPSVPATSEEAALRTLLLAQRTADEAIAEAKAEAEQTRGQAQAEAEQLREVAQQECDALTRQAQERTQAALADLDRQRRQLEGHIEGLRFYEREYRTRLKAYLESQLRDLDTRVPAPPAPPAGEHPPATGGGSTGAGVAWETPPRTGLPGAATGMPAGGSDEPPETASGPAR